MYAHDVLDPRVSKQALSLYRACVVCTLPYILYVISFIYLSTIMPHVSLAYHFRGGKTYKM